MPGAGARKGKKHAATERSDTEEAARRGRRNRQKAMEVERALRESEARMHAFFDHAPTVIYLKDLEGKYLLSNRHTFGSTDVPPNAFVGKTDEELFDKETARAFRENDQRVIASRKTMEIEETVVVDGDRHTFSSIKFPLVDAQGSVYALGGISSDITERKRAEDENRCMAEVSRVLTQALEPEVMLKQIIRASVPLLATAAMLNLLEQDGTLMLIDVVHEDPVQEALLRVHGRKLPDMKVGSEGLGKVLETRTPKLFSTIPPSVLHPQLVNQMGFVSAVVAPIATQHKFLGTITFLRTFSGPRFDDKTVEILGELSHRANLAVGNAILFTEAKLAVRARDDVLAIVSHDLRNLATANRLSAELLARKLPSEPDSSVQRAIFTALRSSEQILRLIEDLQDLSQLRAGTFAIDQQCCELAALIKDATALMEPLALQKSCTIETRIEERAGAVLCDKARINRVFSNVIGNAIKFCPQGAKIFLSVEPKEDLIQFSIQDNGPGIPPDELDRIFEPYHSGKHHRAIGSGLGLFISRAIIEAHGGRIWIESKQGIGTRVFFTLPIAKMS